MHRRDFFKSLAAAATTVYVPKIVEDSLCLGKTIIHDDFTVDVTNKIIHLHPQESPITMLDLYNFLKDEWENEELEGIKFPLYKMT